MNIIGPDSLVFGVEDLAACRRCLLDYGLTALGSGNADEGGVFEALDGTSITLRRHDDPSLPPKLETTSMIRETVYGVADTASLKAIGNELNRDREVGQAADGSLSCLDDSGLALRFQPTLRRHVALAPETINSPGVAPARGANQLALEFEPFTPRPRTLSHVVYFVPDAARAEAFYERLGFVTSDRFINVGPFMRPQGTLDHHTVFFIQTPPVMKGVEHFTFHMAGPTEMLQAGNQFAAKGYRTFWGPGRHMLGSNWFWYFNSPFGCHLEYDADMDLHDNSWVARAVPMTPDNAQIFLFNARDKWIPGGPPPRTV
jgi:catechol 2,3-dioxygenase-like lactoylglutathione lyase family enzyme